jgi:hypothetical protein
LTGAAIAVPCIGLAPQSANAKIRADVAKFVRALRTPGAWGCNERIGQPRWWLIG